MPPELLYQLVTLANYYRPENPAQVMQQPQGTKDERFDLMQQYYRKPPRQPIEQQKYIGFRGMPGGRLSPY